MLTAHKPIQTLNLFVSFWFPLIAILLRLNSYTADLSYLALAAYAFLGKQQVIQALVLSWFFTLINSNAPTAEYSSLFRYVVIFSAFTSIYLKTNFVKQDFLSLYTIIFGIFVIFHSIYISYFPSISILKITSWLIVMILLLKTWSELNTREHRDLQRWIIRFLLLIAFISLPTHFVREIGYIKNSFGFQGVLNHPQAFGATIAILCSILVGELLLQKKPSWSIMIAILLSFFMIFLSQTRTAGLGLIFAIGFSLVFFFILNFFKKQTYATTLRSYRFFLILFFSSLLLLIFYSEIVSAISNFISKGGRVDLEGIFEAYKKARAILFLPMIENISENFITGIGFGVASDPISMAVKRDPIFELPIQASVEKGILILMVLEELGIFGFILFIIWVLLLFYRAVNNGIKALIVVSSIFIINLGEATLFSPGGLGLLILIILTSFVSIPKSLSIEPTALKPNK